MDFSITAARSSNNMQRTAVCSLKPGLIPSLKTRMRSLSTTVWILCATVSTVQSQNSWRMVSWITASVEESTEAVASSSTRMLLLFSRTLPRQNSCLWPTLQFSPFSTTAGGIPFGYSLIEDILTYKTMLLWGLPNYIAKLAFVQYLNEIRKPIF